MTKRDKCKEPIILETANDIIQTLAELGRDEKNVFRGYSKQDELYPNLIRGEIPIAKEESSLLHQFEKYSGAYFHANTPIEFMSCGQHFGLPTRLLDFTHNPFIALSFALSYPKKDKDDEYYYIRYASLEDNFCINTVPLKEEFYRLYFYTESMASRATQCISKVEDFFGNRTLDAKWRDFFDEVKISDAKVYKEKFKKKVILFIDPNLSNQRIMMQQGLFMFPYTLDKEEHKDILKRNTTEIKIPASLRNQLRIELNALGFTIFRLMPDLSNVCSAIKNEAIERINNKKTDMKENDYKVGI